MPHYDTATVATALGVTPKWLDNLLSHNNLDDLEPSSQGVSRRLSLTTVALISLTRELIDSVRLSTPAAIKLASQLLNASSGELDVSPNIHIQLRADALRASLTDALSQAVEITPSPRRGRPRGKPS